MRRLFFPASVIKYHPTIETRISIKFKSMGEGSEDSQQKEVKTIKDANEEKVKNWSDTRLI